MYSQTFQALLKEAEFTKEMLGSGATQIRNANYASRGVYFQAFTSLSTGLERLGKLILILDYHIDHGGFPDGKFIKDRVGHDISLIYETTKSIAVRRSIDFDYLQSLDNPTHDAILRILSRFAKGDRYSNIDLLVGGKPHCDPIASWHTQVDIPLFERHVSAKKKDQIRCNATMVDALLGAISLVRYVSETGDPITDAGDGSLRTGMFEAVAPYRQLYVLQVIRYFSEVLVSLNHIVRSEDIPYFVEIFGYFCNDDRYIKSRKTWAV